MKIVDRIRIALASHAGKTFTAKELQVLLGVAMPDVPTSSLNLSDKARLRGTDGKLSPLPGQSRLYDGAIFEKVAGGYKVLPASEQTVLQTARGSKESDAAVLARLVAAGTIVKTDSGYSLAIPTAAPAAPATVIPAPAGNGKANGAARV